MSTKLITIILSALVVFSASAIGCTAATPFGISCRQNGGNIHYVHENSDAQCEFREGVVCTSENFRDHLCWYQKPSDAPVTQTTSSNSSSTSFPSPTTTQELIQGARLIVIGEIGPVVKYRSFAGYGPKGELIDGTVLGQPDANVPYTDFELIAERVLKDEDHLTDSKSIILRVSGHATAELPCPSVSKNLHRAPARMDHLPGHVPGRVAG